MTIKNTRWFTTLSLLSPKHLDVLHSICKKNWEIYLIITENGKRGSNFHYHVYFESSQYSRGTPYNEYFKPIYHEDKIKITVKTIQTKKVPDTRKQFLSYYFFKESHNTPESTLHNGISDEELTEIFSNRVLVKPKRRVLRYTDAPYILYELSSSLDYELIYSYETVSANQVRYLLRQALEQGYVIHHLYSKIDSIGLALYDLHMIDGDNKVKFSGNDDINLICADCEQVHETKHLIDGICVDCKIIRDEHNFFSQFENIDAELYKSD